MMLVSGDGHVSSLVGTLGLRHDSHARRHRSRPPGGVVAGLIAEHGEGQAVRQEHTEDHAAGPLWVDPQAHPNPTTLVGTGAP